MAGDLLSRGEDGLIAILSRRYAGAELPANDLGIGDDAAWLRHLPASGLLATTDLLVEGVHFDWRWMPADLLGEKAVEVNLSDLAAMGARPRAALLSLVLPPGGRTRLPGILKGIHRALRRAGTPLVGGDASGTDSRTVVSLTLLGAPPRGGPLRRSGARPGDLLVVTGTLGASRTGLALLRGEIRRPRDPARRRVARRVERLHLRPRARLAAGQALAGIARAALDLSDGLIRDLPRLCRASEVGATLDTAHLPVDPAVRRLLGEEPAREAALHGGEDYELLAAVPPRAASRLDTLSQRLKTALTVIGRVEPRRRGCRLRDRLGKLRPLPRGGFDHFEPSR